jgi:hypothetical protein
MPFLSGLPLPGYPADLEWQNAGCERLSQPIRVPDIHLIHLILGLLTLEFPLNSIESCSLCLSRPLSHSTMSFSNLVSDIAFRDARMDDGSSQISHARSHRSHATARSYASTAATSVSISGEVSSQLHSGYSHPLTRAWQADRQLTKVRPQ